MNDDEGKGLEFDLNIGDYNYWHMDNSDNGQENHSMQHFEGLSNERREDYIVDDMNVGEVMNMSFESEEHAYEFYNLYGKISGFSVRKADVTKKDDRTANYRKFLCLREGKRHKKWKSHVNRPKPETRMLCLACLPIKYKKSLNKYVITEFVKEHNHKMATKSSIKHLRSHRKVTDADYAQASTMRMAGVKTSQIMKFFAMQCGGYGNIGFVLKDLYNCVELEEKKGTTNGDAEGAIGYFIGQIATDPTFYFEYEVDIEGRLENIFWMDSVGQMDYKAFGDVLVFDSTYNTNEYHKPLVVLAGVNNHFGTIIFGSALLSEETTEAYDWILGTLVKANGGKKPISVIIDDDKSMPRAIENVLPNARHCLCTFHLKRNAETGTNKCSMVISMFAKFMKKAIPMEEFEEEWHAVVASCGLDGNGWVKKMYAKTSLWAETLLRECFFAGIRSTQWYEQMNALLKRYIKPNMRMYQFVKIHALALHFLREKESKACHEIEDAFLLLSTKLHALEQHATETYTRNIFCQC